jgi:geranylgeranyl diphosphate synthase type II
MIDTYLEWIEAEIRDRRFGTKPKSLYDPLDYVMRLGGKRIRPLLTILAYSLFKSDARKIVPLAVAVEVFHNFTLLHDDIMDNAPLRRGKPTVHQKWNTSTAILAGDVMQIKVYEMLMGISDDKLRSVLDAFNKCATELCEGQQLDMEFETKKHVSESEYIQMIRQKTAALLGFSLEFGALLANAPHTDQVALRQFGINLGIAFQLKDDLLDVYADSKKFGKTIGGDIVSNKKTFLLIAALEKAKGENKVALETWLNRKKFERRAKIKAVTSIYDSLAVRALTEGKIRYYFDCSFEHLNQVRSANDAALRDLAQRLLERQT